MDMNGDEKRRMVGAISSLLEESTNKVGMVDHMLLLMGVASKDGQDAVSALLKRATFDMMTAALLSTCQARGDIRQLSDIEGYDVAMSVMEKQTEGDRTPEAIIQRMEEFSQTLKDRFPAEDSE